MLLAWRLELAHRTDPQRVVVVGVDLAHVWVLGSLVWNEIRQFAVGDLPGHRWLASALWPAAAFSFPCITPGTYREPVGVVQEKLRDVSISTLFGRWSGKREAGCNTTSHEV